MWAAAHLPFFPLQGVAFGLSGELFFGIFLCQRKGIQRNTGCHIHPLRKRNVLEAKHGLGVSEMCAQLNQDFILKPVASELQSEASNAPTHGIKKIIAGDFNCPVGEGSIYQRGLLTKRCTGVWKF